ncbi:transmembrane protein, putative (macronuclear) [Tetrahymena thermophila SB210]|uniref:Transmembrane protein, putative n=1 Tax=Tetrahymena thermophila (strain SB210) TaxID=312017 RepID=W7XFY6_TETTS|nr:transmembrane protein, putative [Tetrahymena thermophila SB210]EWS71759.1 transmembrane protein, putative [Tetrahymena thermophila SB210]|eukprot:XP_012655712.1 transmembrane protein, putative [Tetrahymena thermophila SB210]
MNRNQQYTMYSIYQFMYFSNKAILFKFISVKSYKHYQSGKIYFKIFLHFSKIMLLLCLLIQKGYELLKIYLINKSLFLQSCIFQSKIYLDQMQKKQTLKGIKLKIQFFCSTILLASKKIRFTQISNIYLRIIKSRKFIFIKDQQKSAQNINQLEAISSQLISQLFINTVSFFFSKLVESRSLIACF